jgi:hypothetical protein
MGTPTRKSAKREYSPGLIGIIAIAVGTPLLFGLIWVASQIGKIHFLPTIAVWATVAAAFPMFVFGVVEIVLYYRAYKEGIWQYSWLIFVAIGLIDEIFAFAWVYRSPFSHITVITGAVLMFLGWVIYHYERKVVGETLSDNPWWGILGIVTFGGFAGGAFSWLLQHPAIAPVVQSTAQPVAQSDPTTNPAVHDVTVFIFILGLGVVVVVIYRVLKAVGIIK